MSRSMELLSDGLASILSEIEDVDQCWSEDQFPDMKLKKKSSSSKPSVMRIMRRSKSSMVNCLVPSKSPTDKKMFEIELKKSKTF